MALLREGQVLGQTQLGEPREQSRRLLPCIEHLLSHASVAHTGLEAVAVAIGPGAFTGIRLGLSVAQGLALAWQVPLRPVSSLAGLAWPGRNGDLPVLAVLDARMGEVYAAWYRADASGGIALHGGELLCRPEEVDAGPAQQGWRVAGSGWPAHSASLRTRLGEPLEVLGLGSAGAVAIGAIALHLGAALNRDPGRIEPAYLRDKVALTTAERAAEPRG
ncbi:MAG: tRNA (adenosine(37)-N6)-threonylcarbamoyltransferase complex dimerization subunit type 1 TsaB [Xanthomonadales bacterium]|nr:tRNA (adenosine(37)-N6)-threonylcarbamoyltransferase complex dimerization subunit type 1 TsaB [Xanthomonadales bacterium]